MPRNISPALHGALAPALALLLLGAVAAGASEPSDAPPRIAVPDVLAVQLDGIVLPAEWEGAPELELQQGQASLRMGRRGGTLLLALTSPLSWSPRGHLLLYFAPPSGTQGVHSVGAVRLDYEPLEHDRPRLIGQRQGAQGEERFAPEAAVRSYRTHTTTQLEAAIQLRDLPLEEGSVMCCLRWSRPGAPTDPVWPKGLDIGASPRAIPAGLRQVQSWARLDGLAAEAGPGAFPASRWAQWAQEDEELYRRGSSAHAVARELREEWRKAEKRDRELVPEVLENLDWIAEREPLTDFDLLERANVLRFLNRRAEAAALLGVVAQSPTRGLAYLALRDLTALRVAQEDFEGAAAALERRVALAEAGERDALLAQAEGLRDQGRAHAREVAARLEDATDDRLPRVELRTPHGPIRIVLHARDVPQAVEHFLSLAREGVYDDTLFHSVKGEGRVLGGDPLSRELGCEAAGTGSGPRMIPMEHNARHGHWRGALAFARRLKEENGSQFFLHVAPPERELDRPYTVFGHVEAGYAALDRLEQCDRLKAVVLLPAPEQKR